MLSEVSCPDWRGSGKHISESVLAGAKEAMEIEMFVIIDLSEMDDSSSYSHSRISKEFGPTWIHYDRDAAERELLRLQRVHQ